MSVLASASGAEITFRTNDVVAFVGGANVAAAQQSGHLETLLTLAHPRHRLRFRNFGWEGDTVFAQPRDVGFPPLTNLLRKAGATVVLLQFGSMESFAGTNDLPRFVATYERLLADFAVVTPRLVLVTPPPFGETGPPMPDLTRRNPDLAAFSEAVRAIAARRGLPVVDLFTAFAGRRFRPTLTLDGQQLSEHGQAVVAVEFAHQLGLAEMARHTGTTNSAARWKNASTESVRVEIVAKNRLWFDYSRPMNWAFLGGDRIEQPSSRDHRDPKVRWFPGEMEQFVPLIEKAEARIGELVNNLPALR
jgi:hypothetical protein